MSQRLAPPPVYRSLIRMIRPPLMALTRRDWQGAEHIPAEGGVIVAANHISHFDPFVLAHFLVDHDAAPFYLAKQELFELPVAGSLLRMAGQIPVRRGTADAAHAYRDADTALAAGRVIGFYPEGTITKDPQGWPMRGKTGAARLALATGAPVIPIAQWGAQEVIRPYAAPVPRLLPRKVMRMRAGAPVDLDEFRGVEVIPGVARAATDRIMAAITAELEVLRGATAPAGFWDPACGRRVPTEEGT